MNRTSLIKLALTFGLAIGARPALADGSSSSARRAERAGSAGSQLSLPDLAEQVRPSVVLLTLFGADGTKKGSGTGFVVSTDGRVATNHHVIARADRVVATLANGRKVKVLGVLASNEEKDVAIVQLDNAPLPKPLKLGSSKHLRQGDDVVVIGSPRGLSGTLSTGVVSAIRGKGIGERDLRDDKAGGTRAWEIQITAAISPGSSGSPIMTLSGSVVAIAVGIVRGEGSLGFGVPIEVVQQLLIALPPNAKARPFSATSDNPLVTNLILSAAFFGFGILGFVIASRRRTRRRRK